MHRMIFWALVVGGLLCVVGYIFVVVNFLDENKNSNELVSPILDTTKLNLVVTNESTNTHITLSREIIPLTIEGKTYYFKWKASESLLIITPNKDDFD